MEKKYSIKEKVITTLIIAVIAAIGFSIFAWLEKYISSDENCWITDLPIDDKIPFCEYFALFYLSWYGYLVFAAIYSFTHDFGEFKKMGAMFLITYYFNLIVCFLIPNAERVRPDVIENNNVFATVLRYLYSFDTNTNVFPSEHGMGTITAMIGFSRCFTLFNKDKSKSVVILYNVWGVLICISILFVKQHALLDLLGSVVFSLLGYYLVYITPSIIKKKREKRKESLDNTIKM